MILHNSFDINNEGHLTVGGADTVALAKEYGTPLYVMDENHIRSMCRLYKKAAAEAFGEKSLPLFASKAMSCMEIYRIAASEGLGIDCVSPGEIYTAAKAGFPMEKVYFHGNNKTAADLELALDMGVGRIVVDNPDELCRLSAIAVSRGVTVPILLRITPGIDPHTHQKIVTGNIDSKFGSAIATGAAFDIVKQALSTDGVELLGLHCHVGSQIFDAQPFTDAADIMCRFMAELSEKLGFTAAELNLGGGLGVRYTELDPVLDYEAEIKKIGVIVRESCAKNNIPVPTVMLEPGRSIVAASGATLYTVGSVKRIPGFKNYVSIDGGMPDNPRYTLYQSRYTALIANRAKAEADFNCTIAGRCCESGDLIAEDIDLATPECGDILAVLVTGAYNYSMASNYNRIPRPPVIMIKDGKARIAVKRESFDDLIRNDL